MESTMFRLKDLSRAAEKDLRSGGKYKKNEKFSDRNEAILKKFYTELIEGKIDFVKHQSKETFTCLHRSTRKDISVQLSFGKYEGGVLVPSGHVNIRTFKDLTRENYPTGWWEMGKIA